MAGFTVIAGCAAFCGIGVISHFMTHTLRSTTYLCAVGGFILYAIGRILVYVDQKKQKPESKRILNRSKDAV